MQLLYFNRTSIKFNRRFPAKGLIDLRLNPFDLNGYFGSRLRYRPYGGQHRMCAAKALSRDSGRNGPAAETSCPEAPFRASGAKASELEVDEFLGLAQKRQAACEGRSY
jgi:hypothetical protein